MDDKESILSRAFRLRSESVVKTEPETSPRPLRRIERMIGIAIVGAALLAIVLAVGVFALISAL